jgi:predicted acetyltransferase
VVRDELLSPASGGAAAAVRLLGVGELDGAHDLVATSLRRGPIADRYRAAARAFGEPGRTLGAFVGGELVGTTSSFATATAVPGGAVLPTAGVIRVGVRADRTRRGVLTTLMRHQLAGLAAGGVVLASLRASEAGIYGRFGFGVASRSRDLRVRRRGPPGLRPAPAGGSVRVLDRAQVLATLVDLHARIGLRRPGGITRPPSWWALNTGRRLDDGDDVLAAVHTGADGDDGFVVASTPDAPDGGAVLLRDLHAADAAVAAALWRFVLDRGPGGDVVGRRRPVDEPVELLLADPRDCATTGVEDETWLRVLDVAAALAGRGFGAAGPVRLRVHDPLLPANSGVYRIAAGAAERVGGPAADAELRCDVAGLAMAYLGDRAPSELVAARWWRAVEPAAVERADAAFATPVRPWCGTYF